METPMPRRSLALRGLALLAGVGLLIGYALLLGRDLPDAPAAKSDNRAETASKELETARAAEQAFLAFREGLWPDAQAKGISRPLFDRAFAGLAPDPDVLEFAANQPEHLRSAGDYMGLLVSDTRIANGKIKLAETAATLAAVETLLGVDRHVVLAIWGIESGYGAAMGTHRVIRSLATLAHSDTRRPQFWRGELIAALAILERGDIAPDVMTGSWAGAMGHTQFMPSTYQQFAIDFDKDGRRDIWGTIPDALGSTANYLKASGWRTGIPWGLEIRLPQGFDYALAAPGSAQTLAQWQALGLTLAVGRAAAAPDLGPLLLVSPAGHAGPQFLVTANFKAILRYNNSVAYALAVGHLADRLAGGASIVAAWPSGDRALSRAEREELQRRLDEKGFAPGPVDGILGVETRVAIRKFQRAAGLIEDGHPGPAVLERLRAP